MSIFVGIDLGTTNSSLHYVNLDSLKKEITAFLIPQLAKSGELKRLPILPSCCYLATNEELSQKEMDLGDRKLNYCIGEKALFLGANRPDRLVFSSKSWLCYGGAHRKEPFLPLSLEESQNKISPLETAAKILEHFAWSWKREIAKENPALELSELDIVITIPASFGEMARKLTEEAAHLAGLKKITLLEEPQAAFYAWLNDHKKNWQTHISQGEQILVVDVGGGTTDFSLIECKEEGLTRMAVGDHILLGGDNMDLAIGAFLEEKMGLSNPLNSFGFQKLVRLIKEEKEALLAINSKDDFEITWQGSGSSVIAGSLRVKFTKQEVIDLLQKGFFQPVNFDEVSSVSKNNLGLKTFGLPFEENPNILFHLARFLKAKLGLNKFPTAILFNGGVFKSPIIREWVLEALRSWFPDKPLKVLENKHLDSACSKGAVAYALSRQGEGVNIKSGSPRSYYLGLDVDGKMMALTLFSRGSKLDEQFCFDQTLSLKANQYISFPLFSSAIRPIDKQGTLVDLDDDSFTKLPEVRSFLKYGKSKTGEEEIEVKVKAHLTALQNLELSLQSEKSSHIWQLEFFLDTPTQVKATQNIAQETWDQAALKAAETKIKEAFKKKPFNEKIVETLEDFFQKKKQEWPTSILRFVASTLLECSALKNEISESKWWNLLGFSMRPGIGFPLDHLRIGEVWKILLEGSRLKKSEDVQLQQWIAFRRMALGFSKGQQKQLADQLLQKLFGKEGKIVFRSQKEAYYISEILRTLGSFELLDPSLKIKIGEAILKFMEEKGKSDAASLYAIGRLGSRTLATLSLSSLIPASKAASWIKRLLALDTNAKKEFTFALKQLTHKAIREFSVEEALITEVNSILKKFPELDQIEGSHFEETFLGDAIPQGLSLRI